MRSEARRAELTEIETLLLTSGAQLGFDTELSSETRGVIWQQADRVVYAFTLSHYGGGCTTVARRRIKRRASFAGRARDTVAA